MAALTTTTLVRVCRQQTAPLLGAVYVSHRDSSDLAAYKRGRGGRSSFSGRVVTVFGASGFLGKYVVNRLGRTGSQVICPYRGEPYFMKDLKLAGDLGQILFFPFNLRDEESLRKVMKYSNVVINLIGRDWETRNYKFEDVHVKGAQDIARVARECGVEKLIHFSHLNAQPNPPSIYVKGGSGYLRSKHWGEMAVREEFPEAIVFRPADIYGPEDRFIRYYANHWRRSFGMMPLWKRGAETVKMPVFCSDVAEAVRNAVEDPDAVGRTYECVGPNSYLLSELVDFFYRCMRYDNFRRFYVTPMFKAKVKWFSYMPSYPILTKDKLDREHVSDQMRGHATIEDLNVKLTRIEDRAPWELRPLRNLAYYEEKVGEFAEPAPPAPLAS